MSLVLLMSELQRNDFESKLTMQSVNPWSLRYHGDLQHINKVKMPSECGWRQLIGRGKGTMIMHHRDSPGVYSVEAHA